MTPAEIDALGAEKWQRGLCHIFAEALQNYLGVGKIGALWVNGHFKHAYLSHAGWAYDSLAREEREEAFAERWRLKYGESARLDMGTVPKVVDLFGCVGITFGSDGRAALYHGPERNRWLKEAETAIRENDFFQTIPKA
jgi:hypothetical protein